MSSAQSSLARKTLHGIGVSYGSAILTGAMQIATTSVVARMVAPREFGVLAMAQMGVRLATYFSQFGVGAALIQKPDLSESDISAAHLLAIGAGVIFTTVGLVFAPLGQSIFHSSEVVWVIRTLAFTFLLTGFAVAPQNVLRRHLRFGAISAVELTAYLIGYAVPCLTLVLLGHGLLGLVAGNLGVVLVQLILLHWIQPVKWSLIREWGIYGKLLTYGSKVSITGFLEYVTTSMDSFVIGRYLGPKPLGLYTRASNLATVPLYMITSAASRVLFPAFSRVQHDKANLAKTYKQSLTLLFVLTCPLGLFLIPAAPYIVRLLLGKSWSEAALPLAVFGATVPFNMAVILPGIVLDATGTLTKKLHVRGLTLLVAGFLLYMNRQAGIMTIAYLMLGSSAMTFLAYHLLVVRQLRLSLSSALAPVFFGAFAGAVPLLLIKFLAEPSGVDGVMKLALEFVILIASYVVILAFSPFPVVNAALSRVLATMVGGARGIPESDRSRCLARQIFATVRAEGGY